MESSPDSYEPWVRDSLFAFCGVYQPRGDGSYWFRGPRPGTDWHGHRYFPKILWMLSDGRPIAVTVWKQRWRQVGTTTTCHSRPDDDPVLLRFCTLIVFLRVWSWVSSEVGFHHRAEVFEDLDSCGTDRTVQRWAARAMGDGLWIQQAIRLAIREEVEPRPVESLFVGGLSPPDAVLNRRWTCPSDVEALWRGYAMLLVASRKLAKQASYLLAEARRRCHP